MDGVAQTYSQSLLELAIEENKVEQYMQEMQEVATLFQDQEIYRFFTSVALSDDDKYQVLNQSLKGNVSTYIYHFLLLLIKKRRIKSILMIAKQFQMDGYEYLGIHVGKLYSAYPLKEKEIEAIEQAIAKKENHKVKLNPVIDESLLAGIKVVIENRIYDNSMKYKLNDLKNSLLGK